MSPDRIEKRGEFRFAGEACDGDALDLSAQINEQVKLAGGDAIVNLVVLSKPAGDCFDLRAYGDVVSVRPRRSGAIAASRQAGAP